MQKTLVLHYSGSVTDRKVSSTHTHTHPDKFEHIKPVLIKKKNNKIKTHIYLNTLYVNVNCTQAIIIYSVIFNLTSVNQKIVIVFI